MYRNILVPVDGSEAAKRALTHAIELAKAHGARIRLVHVVSELPAISPGAWGLTLDHVIEALRSEGEAILASSAASVREAGVAVDSKLVEVAGGPAGEQIVQAASSWPADLIVCGTHGRRGVRRIVMGSDAEYVVRHTELPVLLLRAA